jgi:hypothetical protein
MSGVSRWAGRACCPCALPPCCSAGLLGPPATQQGAGAPHLPPPPRRRRSPSIVVGYLMHHRRWRLLESFKWVKEKRASININPGADGAPGQARHAGAAARSRRGGGGRAALCSRRHSGVPTRHPSFAAADTKRLIELELLMHGTSSVPQGIAKLDDGELAGASRCLASRALLRTCAPARDAPSAAAARLLADAACLTLCRSAALGRLWLGREPGAGAGAPRRPRHAEPG